MQGVIKQTLHPISIHSLSCDRLGKPPISSLDDYLDEITQEYQKISVYTTPLHHDNHIRRLID